MINATNLKNGTTFILNGKVYQVLKYTHTKIGRGGATVRVTIRDLESGTILEKAYGANTSFDLVETQKRKLQFLYKDTTKVFFMDPKTYEQIEIPTSTIGDTGYYLKEGETADVLFWYTKALSIELPPKITLKVSETDPGVKGNSATNIYKSAILENGLKLKVPLFIKTGDKVRVDTRTGKYIERAK